MRGRLDVLQNVLLNMLPGVEFVTRPAVHFLCVYDKYNAAFHTSLFFHNTFSLCLLK